MRYRVLVPAEPNDAIDGELRTQRPGVAALERWLGRRVYRNDLEAFDNRQTRRQRARRLALQGPTAEAANSIPAWAYSPGRR
jgi:hypothetical protein